MRLPSKHWEIDLACLTRPDKTFWSTVPIGVRIGSAIGANELSAFLTDALVVIEVTDLVFELKRLDEDTG